MAGIFDFLHIKGRTAGSSNELSFDVLDAARSELDEKRKKNRGQRKANRGSSPGRSFGSPYGAHVAGAPLAAASEVQKRKQKRRAHSIRLKVLATCVIIVILCVGVLFSHRIYQERMDFNGRLNNLISQFVQLDRSLVQIDSLMEDPFNSFWEGQRQDALNEMPELSTSLQSLSDQAKTLSSETDSQADSAAYDEVIVAANAREELLKSSADVFELASTINQQSTSVEDVWACVLDIDKEIRDAASLASVATTEQQTVEARDKTQNALTQLQQALADFEYLEATIENSDFSIQRQYLEKRIEALQYAVDSSDALISGDRERATRMNNLYNETEREAAGMAEKLTSTPADLVVATYQTQIDELLANYQNARDAVSQADAELRPKIPSA